MCKTDVDIVVVYSDISVNQYTKNYLERKKKWKGFKLIETSKDLSKYWS